jgi:hypothetical protein
MNIPVTCTAAECPICHQSHVQCPCGNKIQIIFKSIGSMTFVAYAGLLEVVLK